MKAILRPSRVCFCGALIALLVGCGTQADETETVTSAIGDPSPGQTPLSPATIPQFVNQLTVPRVFAPTVVIQNGQVVRNDYTVNVAKTLMQLLPPPLPQTNVLAYGGQVKIPGSSQTEFVRSSPGPIFDNTKNLPTRVTWQNEIRQPHARASLPGVPVRVQQRPVAGPARHAHARPRRAGGSGRHRRGVVHALPRIGHRSELRDPELRHAERAGGDAAFLS